MNLPAAFLRLIRWPNLLFIILTQLLFKYCVVDKIFVFNKIEPALPLKYFLLLSFASVLIAAAGYIINDYFDLNIDQINKPDNLVVDKVINRRWAILWHIVFSFIGFIVSVFVAIKTNIFIALGNLICISLLWFYSTTFKKKLLIGNTVISLLTAWVILVIYFAVDINFPFHTPGRDSIVSAMFHKIFRLAILYAAFAFIISLIREVVKDMEDIKGDAKYGCKTMPIIWGIPVSKMFVGVWIVVLTGALITLQVYASQLGWWLSSVYCTILILLPLLWILRKLYQAQTSQHYHQLSVAIKFVMLTGILSMFFFRFYL